MFEKKDLQKLCFACGVLWVVAGAVGMVLSFVYLASASMADITAGTSGFVAGAVLMGSGLLSCTLIAVKSSASGPQQSSVVDTAA